MYIRNSRYFTPGYFRGKVRVPLYRRYYIGSRYIIMKFIIVYAGIVMIKLERYCY